MKKICCAVLVALGLMLPNAAKAETMGVYVAPKLILSVQHAEGEASFAGNSLGSDAKSSGEAGGALAVGYDFSRKFNIPVRAELEFAGYGNTSKEVYDIAEVKVKVKMSPLENSLEEFICEATWA